jgi:hypothetical protein
MGATDVVSLATFIPSLGQPIRALAASDDGKAIVDSESFDGAGFAIMWRAPTQPIRIETTMAARGMAVPTDGDSARPRQSAATDCASATGASIRKSSIRLSLISPIEIGNFGELKDTAAHSFKMDVVADGVETLSELEQLQATACDEMQGFLLGASVSSGSIRHSPGGPLVESGILEKPSGGLIAL